MPLVSVIVPVYNGEKRLAACLRSILAQDEEDLEVLAVDDGSTDGTWAILTDLAREDSRLIPIHQENGGVSQARNAALQRCRGRYVRFADADDELPPGAISALIRSMEICHSDLAIGAYTEVAGPLRTRRCLAPKQAVLQGEAFLRHLCPRSNSFYYGVLWNKLFLGDIIRREQLRFAPELHWGEDFLFVTGYLRHVHRVSYLEQPVYNYYRSVSGMTTTQFLDCALHPLANCRVKWRLYQGLRALYQSQGVYPRYRRVLWLYLFRVTLNN